MEFLGPDRSLLNPKFEGYRLDLSLHDAISRFPLEHKPTQATISGKVPLSFKEMQSRITHNHLVADKHGNRLLYIDAEYKVILINIILDTLTPSFRVIYELPRPVQTSPTNIYEREYPSAAFIDSTTVVISDGRGLLYILSIQDQDSGTAQAIGVYTLPLDIPLDCPFRLHSVHTPSSTSVVLVLSFRSSGPTTNVTEGRKSEIPYDVLAAKVDVFAAQPNDQPRPMDILWRRRGLDVPIYAAFVQSLQSYLLISESAYADVVPEAPYQPSPDELAPIPRANERLDEPAAEISENKPPPYSWTQTSDTVTIAFPLPANTDKRQIKVIFSTHNLTVLVENNQAKPSPHPSFSNTELWDGISPSSSFWTWDREAEHSYGLLTLHLEKKNEVTRWTSVFASSSDQTEVLETLDPSELWNIRDVLEKYTAELRDGKGGLGMGGATPSLAEGEMDEEIDSSIGRQVCLSWVETDGSTPSWCRNNQGTPIQLLSTPVPGLLDDEISIISKNNIDGIAYHLDVSSTPPKWVHKHTFSALAFVLASKQDTRFTYHIPGKAVFAFEGGLRDRGGNVYIYRASPVQEMWAKQAILKVDDGRGGSLLGVAVLQGKSEQLTVACLSEGELVLIKNI